MLSEPTIIAKEIAKTFQHELANNLIGVYLHGSLAMGCFNPESSDIDILVVVEDNLSLGTKKMLGKSLVEISDKYSQNIELSILTLDVLNNFKYPTPYELHFSPDNKKSYENESIDLNSKDPDPDLAAHFVITRKFGKTLYGKSIKDVFPKVKDDYYLDSIARDSELSYWNIINGASTGTCSVPTYAVLNFCRVLAFIQDNEITSKKSGAVWGLNNLPNKFTPIIHAAANEYEKKGSSKKVDCALLKEFARYSKEKIDSANTYRSY